MTYTQGKRITYTQGNRLTNRQGSRMMHMQKKLIAHTQGMGIPRAYGYTLHKGMGIPRAYLTFGTASSGMLFHISQPPHQLSMLRIMIPSSLGNFTFLPSNSSSSRSCKFLHSCARTSLDPYMKYINCKMIKTFTCNYSLRKDCFWSLERPRNMVDITRGK